MKRWFAQTIASAARSLPGGARRRCRRHFVDQRPERRTRLRPTSTAGTKYEATSWAGRWGFGARLRRPRRRAQILPSSVSGAADLRSAGMMKLPPPFSVRRWRGRRPPCDRDRLARQRRLVDIELAPSTIAPVDQHLLRPAARAGARQPGSDRWDVRWRLPWRRRVGLRAQATRSELPVRGGRQLEHLERAAPARRHRRRFGAKGSSAVVAVEGSGAWRGTAWRRVL